MCKEVGTNYDKQHNHHLLHVLIKVEDGLTSASSTNLNKQGPLPSIKLVKKQFGGRYAISSEEFTSEVVGAKSRNIGYLKGKVLSWVGIPTSVDLPFGVFEKVLSDGLNQLVESCREVTTTKEKLRRRRLQCPKGVAQDSFKGFCTILVGMFFLEMLLRTLFFF
ncbi:alpha-glucan water dikinase 1, chloroplastic-like [Camellia sinensis]|uniref:alpha-glucan water dikinase 1, chloroplastic-like n=1 Tax=Camellia sinensis TaxID=4442 RepID=UPI001036D3E8|nr:alpha-glucan water dikinase 1, chloroplastic-like [Camellia sinensis]